MKKFLFLFLFSWYQEGFSQHVAVDSFIVNPLKIIKSKFIFIGEDHFRNINNSLYIPLITKNLADKKKYNGIILEMSPTDVIWIKMQLAKGDTSALLNSFIDIPDFVFWRKMSSLYINIPFDNIPIIGVDAIRDWKHSLFFLLKFCEYKLQNNNPPELFVLKNKIKKGLKNLNKKNINEIINYVNSNKVFLNYIDILISIHSMELTLDQAGFRKISIYKRDKIILANLCKIDSIFDNGKTFFGIFGHAHLSKECFKRTFFSCYCSFVYLNNLLSIEKGRLEIKTLIIYYPFEEEFYKKNKVSLYTCPFDNQILEKLRNSKNAEIIPLFSCFDYILINLDKR